jgi:hypothetical protein
MDRAAIVQRRTEDEWAELLEVRVEHENDEVVALLVFADVGEAWEYVDLSSEAGLEDGWEPSAVGLGDLAVLCATLGVGYLAFPRGPGLSDAYSGPVLDVVDALTVLP